MLKTQLNLFSIKLDIKLIIYPVIYILLGMICYRIVKKVITKIASKGKKTRLKNQRVETLISLITNIIKYVIVIIVAIGILGTYGVNVTSIVAGLGVTTAIIGLAFQDLAKDIIAGFSIITEAQYDVGDTIEVDGFVGQVVFLGLKTTRIRNYKGATKIIANHNMDKIVNYSLNNSLAIVNVGVAYEEKEEKVEKVLNELAKTLNGKMPEAKGELQILGITDLADSSVVYTVALEVSSMQQYTVERLLRKEIKRAFDDNNIKIPYPQIEVHNGK